MPELDKTYDPKAVEAKWYARWLERGDFHSDASRDGTPYCIVIPPPNVTGILHMGHALNNTIQDILVRWRRMQGHNTVWVPGTDHAGIATQNVVERALRKQGLTREALGREEFVKRVWEWREQYGGTIVKQLKLLGASCDWERERFTMDEGLSAAVAEVFVRLYDKGLIYKANYIINWCPRCQTALSDEESEHQDTAGKLYHIRYPVHRSQGREPQHILVATTRPETLLGDVAVAVNPQDERYRWLVGQTILLPVLHRELVVIEDHYVDPQFGTGVVKVTPAHDPNDFQMAQRHRLEPLCVMNGDGTMSENAGPYAGLDRFECRRRIVADLQAAGLLEKIEEHRHAVGHCYRCDTVVEPRLSPQWFVRMKPLAEPALRAVQEGRIVFVPDRWTKVYTEWMENIRDWCISRQIWWGHRIPVFTCDACRHEWAARAVPGACPTCGGAAITQDEDVLDTWFSSWLWPFSVYGWPERSADLAFYYPTNTLVTASEIIFFWVARMIMAGYEFMGDLPFREVYIHGTVRDDQGRKMSKSLGNSIDPITIIDQYSADAMRFSLMMITATGQDVFLSNDKFEIGRNFGTKLWNAARFMQLHGAGPGPGAAALELDPALLSADDRHLLARLNQAIVDCTEHLQRFRFNDAAHALYEFVWHQYCDWYVEYSKDVLYGEPGPRRDQVFRLMHHVYACALRLLHPFMPFVTEELWHGMGYGREENTILRAPWPKPWTADRLQAWGITDEVVAYVDAKHELIRAGRQLRADYSIVPSQKVDFILKPSSADGAGRLRADEAPLRSLLRAGTITIDPGFTPPKAVPGAVSGLGSLYMPLEGLIDVAAERTRLNGQIEKLAEELDRVRRKLDNPDFVNKAKPEVVEQQRARRQESEEKLAKLRKLLEALGG
jgi:valyl-tRNA synthetase